MHHWRLHFKCQIFQTERQKNSQSTSKGQASTVDTPHSVFIIRNIWIYMITVATFRRMSDLSDGASQELWKLKQNKSQRGCLKIMQIVHSYRIFISCLSQPRWVKLTSMAKFGQWWFFFLTAAAAAAVAAAAAYAAAAVALCKVSWECRGCSSYYGHGLDFH